MGAINKNSLVSYMTSLRHKGFKAHHFTEMVLRQSEESPRSALEKLKFLSFGSPALHFILFQIHTYVLPSTTSEKPQKLLLTEEYPLSAQFWELCLNFFTWSVLCFILG